MCVEQRLGHFGTRSKTWWPHTTAGRPFCNRFNGRVADIIKFLAAGNGVWQRQRINYVITHVYVGRRNGFSNGAGDLTYKCPSRFYASPFCAVVYARTSTMTTRRGQRRHVNWLTTRLIYRDFCPPEEQRFGFRRIFRGLMSEFPFDPATLSL